MKKITLCIWLAGQSLRPVDTVNARFTTEPLTLEILAEQIVLLLSIVTDQHAWFNPIHTVPLRGAWSAIAGALMSSSGCQTSDHAHVQLIRPGLLRQGSQC